jgi:hypothetical protein
MGASLVHVPVSDFCSDPTLVLFGGVGGMDGSLLLNDVHVYNTALRLWTRLELEGEPPLPRESHSACLWMDSNNHPFIVIYGGYVKHHPEGDQSLADVVYIDLGLLAN